MKTKIVHEDTFKIVMSAVKKMVSFIAPTYGPASNKVIISKQMYKMVIDDGVAIARDFELEDEAEQAVVNVIREVAIRTNDRVGDGTTSSLIMLQAIMEEIAKKDVKQGHKISAELKKAASEAKEQLLKKAKKISDKEDLERVARVSFDNPEIAKMISSLLHEVGKEGIVSMDKSNTMETTSERVEGIEIKTGFISPYFINDNRRMEAVQNKPLILITSYRLTNANDLIPLMEKMLTGNKRDLLVIADGVEGEALNLLVANKSFQQKPDGSILPPVFSSIVAVGVPFVEGVGKMQYLEDLCTLTGATLFTEDKGNRIDNAELTDLGKADLITTTSKNCIISGAKGSKEGIEKAKTMIKTELSLNPKDSERQDLEIRLARLSQGIAVIKVGAPTEAEYKALKYKVEDALHATKSAFNHGVVAGAGIALSQLKTSSPILNKALKYPARQLMQNMGLEDIELKAGEAHNVVSGETGDYMKVGVIDPVEVLIAGIESAVSIAEILATSHGILCEVKEKSDINNN